MTRSHSGSAGGLNKYLLFSILAKVRRRKELALERENIDERLVLAGRGCWLIEGALVLVRMSTTGW